MSSGAAIVSLERKHENKSTKFSKKKPARKVVHVMPFSFSRRRSKASDGTHHNEICLTRSATSSARATQHDVSHSTFRGGNAHVRGKRGVIGNFMLLAVQAGGALNAASTPSRAATNVFGAFASTLGVVSTAPTGNDRDDIGACGLRAVGGCERIGDLV